MGAACARELAAQGYKVAVMSASGKGEALGKSLGGLGFTGSNTDPGVLGNVVGTTLDRWGRIDAVINSAGHPPKGKLLEIGDADWHKGLDMILLNIIQMARLVTPIMAKQGGGAFVNISTFAAFEPDPGFPVSCPACDRVKSNAMRRSPGAGLSAEGGWTATTSELETPNTTSESIWSSPAR